MPKKKGDDASSEMDIESEAAKQFLSPKQKVYKIFDDIQTSLDKKENLSLALIGELDALRIPTHKYANKDTDSAHCCGHHAQLTGIVGAAIALSVPEIAQKLDGQIEFFAVPAEEYGEVEFKNTLIE